MIFQLSSSKRKKRKAKAFKYIFMTNNLRIEYMVRECVPKVGRENQGKEIVRGKERQNVQFTLYLTVPLIFYSIPVTMYRSTPQGVPKSNCCSIQHQDLVIRFFGFFCSLCFALVLFLLEFFVGWLVVRFFWLVFFYDHRHEC